MTNFQKMKQELREAQEKAKQYEEWLKRIIIEKYTKTEIEEKMKEVGLWQNN